MGLECFLKQLFKGQLSLTMTYWAGVWLALVASRIVFMGINRGYLTAQTDEVLRRVEIVNLVFASLLSLYLFAMVRALWLSGHNERSMGGWGWIGLIQTTVTALIVSFSTVTLFFPSLTTPYFLIQADIRELDKTLPQRIDDITTLSRVKLENGVIIYQMDIAEDYGEPGAQEVTTASMELVENQELCTDLQGYFTGGVSALVYEYKFRDALLKEILYAQDCLDWITAQ